MLKQKTDERRTTSGFRDGNSGMVIAAASRLTDSSTTRAKGVINPIFTAFYGGSLAIDFAGLLC